MLRKIISLALTLVVFCVISAGLLAYVYLITSQQISVNAQLALAKARREVLGGTPGTSEVVSVKGYAGPIDLLVGIDDKGAVTGVKVLSHRETPGLGANIEKSSFLGQFVGKTVKSPLVPKQDIDALTGATISSKAVGAGVREALQRIIK